MYRKQFSQIKLVQHNITQIELSRYLYQTVPQKVLLIHNLNGQQLS